ncbi:MAG: hypothetical protein MPJ24_05955 [Pirellulaceae bacterium]|nr:hypothetical protein [Pirellulaceae bacterium]
MKKYQENARQIFIIDGYEQIAWWRKFALKFFLVGTNLKIIVTAHRGVGFPRLFETRFSGPLAERVVWQVLKRFQEGGSDLGNWSAKEGLNELLGRAEGDMRELMFSLYDHFEKRVK